MSGPFKMKGFSPFTKTEKKKSEITSSTDRKLTAAEMLKRKISQKEGVVYYINTEGKVHSRTGGNTTYNANTNTSATNVKKSAPTTKESPAKGGLKHFTKAHTHDRTTGGDGGR